jgi:hypothetical protein
VQIITGVVGPAPEHSWTFGTDGTTTFPTGGRISSTKGGTSLDGGLDGGWTSLTNYYSTGNYAACVTGYSDGTLHITAYNDGGPNPSKDWVFDNTGTLTFPDGTTSTGAVITAAQSSSYIIQTLSFSEASPSNFEFGVDGSLTLPIGVSIDESSGSQFPRIIADSGKAFSLQGQGSTGSAAIAWLDYESTSSQYAAVGVNKGGGGGLANVVLTAGSSTPTLKVWRFDETGAFTFPDNSVQTTAYSSTYTGWFKAAGTVVQLDTLLARVNSTGTMQISSTIVETEGQGAAFAWNGVRNQGATMSAFGQGGTNWVMPGSWLDISATPLNNDFEVATVSVFKLGGTGSLYRITYVGATNDQWSVVIERVAKG